MKLRIKYRGHHYGLTHEGEEFFSDLKWLAKWGIVIIGFTIATVALLFLIGLFSDPYMGR
jgi:hypothetical protein